jgi:thiamine pyrophosphate-dependent acetolactate synthase large subunit-like protein
VADLAAQPGLLHVREISGALGVLVTEASQLDDALLAATAHDGPALVEILRDPELI